MTSAPATTPSRHTTLPPRCSANPSLAAAAICTSCRRPFAGKFLAVRTDGRAICYTCAQREDVDVIPRDDLRDEDPILRGSWKESFTRVVADTPVQFANDFTGAVGPALRAGYLWTVFGYVLTWMWLYIFQYQSVMEWLESSFEQPIDPNLMPWIPWAAIPIMAALRLFVGAAFFHFGLRLSGAPKETYGQHLRFFALSSVTLLLCVIPIAGPILAIVAWLNAAMAYGRVRYKLSGLGGILAVVPGLLVVVQFGPTAMF